MECGLCGTVNRANARFCGGCGSPLARHCPNCKAELDAGLSFCDQCGTTLDAVPTVVPAAPVAAGAVRKTVTVLFADLGGSTGFGERTDPEISRVVLAQYHALLQETIDAHRGTVAKFMGDGMMATFGIPEVAEDDARRAALAGVDVQRRFEEFAADVLARYGEPLTLRVGINTGEVVIAAGDADLVGDALNVAARLEKACRPGHVLVGDETWRITRGDLAYEPLGEVTVAGRAGPVGTYEVIGTGAATTDPVAPFVGRVGETTRLRAAFDRARTDACAVLVTVLGSPGMGKTRLSRELASSLAAAEEATTYEIRCDRSGGATFAPFADLVREAAGLAELEDGDHAADVTRDRIGALVHDDTDRARVVDVIAGVLGAAPARSVEETFWGIRRVVESLATDRPLVVVIDDIQWAEPKLLDLLEHLAEWVQAAAVLLVCLARPELRELRPALTEPGRRVADVLALDGLDASATAELASGLLGSALPSELINRLPVSTDGNPLFVRELVRMLVDDAVIRRRDDGVWELAIDAEAIEVPPTIQSLLATRVERLPTEELRVLELASVVGAEFSVGALRELAGDDLAVTAVLERLRRKELVEPTGSYWGDDPLHRFHHVLIRDAAYRRLLKTTRAELHRRVGEWTDSIAADLVGEQETAIAFHYEQAHRYRMELGTVDEDTDRLGRRAAELLTVAARRALDREDLTSAGALARRALAALPDADVDDRADLLLIACECFLSSGDVTAGAPLVDALDELSGDNEQLGAWAACYRAQLIGLTDPDGVVAAEEIASTAATALAGLGDGAGEAKAHQVRALLLARLGRVGEAEVVLDLALGAARASDDRRRVTAVLGAAPQAALFGPSPVARAGGRCLDVVRLLRITTASPSVEATSMRCQAVLEALRGRFDVSRSMLASARASLEELGLRHGLLETDLFTGMVELIAGDPGAAIDPLRSAYEGLGTLGVGADAGQAAALLAIALLARGEIDEAELMAGASEALAGQNLKTAIAWRTARAEVHAARGDAAAGVTLAEEAVEIAAGTDLILDHADACVVLADLCELSGDAPGAERARAEARRLYEAKGATVPAARLVDAIDEAAVAPVVPTPESTSTAMPTDRRHPIAENTASRFMEALRTAFNSKDRAALGRLIAPGSVHDDRRSIVASVGLDPRGRLVDIEATIDQGFSFAEPVIIAVRGERLALSRMVTRTAAGDESARLSVNELDAEGRMVRSTLFDDDDLPAALRALDAAYFVGEGEPFQRLLTVCGKFGSVSLRDDTAELADLAAPGFVFTDRRLLGYGDGDLQYLLDAGYTGLDRVDGSVVDRVLHLAGSALLTVQRWLAISDTGSEFEQVTCYVMHVDESGLVDRLELYDEADFSTALARLDTLSVRTPAVTNRATDAIRMGMAVLSADPRNARSFMADSMGTLTTPDIQREDRRRLIASPFAADGADFVDEVAAIFEVFDRIEVEPVAVRGEQLTLVRLRCVRQPDFESTWLALYEYDDQDRLAHEIDFDDEDLAAALAELDRAYYLGEGAAFQRVLRAAGRYATASLAGDLDGIRDCLADDFVVVDRQPLGFGAGDRDYFIDMRRLAEDDPDGVNRMLRVNEHALLAVYVSRPVTVEGTRYERSGALVMGIDASDRVNRIEMYADDDFDIAYARFQELGAPRPAGVELSNQATAWILDGLETCNAAPRDVRAFLDAVVTDETFPGVQRQDRRRVVSMPDVVDAGGWAENLASIYDVFDRIDAEPIAIRGQRLALFRVSCVREPDFEAGMLCLYEFDERDHLVLEVDFDEDDLTTAIDLLDERYFAGEGAEHADIGAWSRTCARAIRDRDWDGYAAMLAEEFVAVSHFQFGFELGPDAYVDWLRATEGQMPGLTVVAHRVEVVGRAILASALVTGTTPEGNEYEWRFHLLNVAAPDGRLARCEYFEDDQYETAVARLHELGAPGADGRVLENAATRLMQQSLEVATARRFDLLRELLADDFVRADHRTGVSAPVANGPDEFVTAYAAWFEVGFDRLSISPVAVRGDHLALARLVWSSADGRTVGFLGVYETNADGVLVRGAHFDPENIDGALDELDERYIAGEGADHEYIVRRVGDFSTAQRARDWDAFEALVAEDFALVDHRPMGFPDRDRAGYVGVMRATDEQTPGARMIPRTLDVRGDVVLARTGRVGSTPDGFEYEWEQIAVRVWAAGLLRRVELFAVGDAAAARARFEALAERARITPYVDNRLVRITARSRWLARYFDDRPMSLTEDCVLADRRAGVNAGSVTGGASVQESIQSGIDVFGVLEMEPVAVRGDRLALYRWAFVAEGGFEAPGLCVIEMRDDDRVQSLTSFDESDLAAAIACLEQRHVELRADAITPQELTTAVGSRAFNARDWDALREVYAADMRFVLHTPFRTEGGWADYLAQLQVMVEQVPDVAVVFAKVTTRGRCGLSLLPFTATTPEGSRYSWSMVQVTRMGDDGRIAEFELFDIEQWDDAVARFERWAAESSAPGGAQSSPLLGNTASRVTEEAARGFGGERDQVPEHRADDLVRVDHRRMIGAPTTTSRDDFSAASRAFEDLGMTDLTFEVLAVRGDRCCLGRLTYSGADFEVKFLTVVGCNESDKMAWIDNFDDDDLGTALETLDERFITGEGAAHESLIRRSGDLRSAYRDGDWAALQELFAPDAALADHRSIGQGWHGRDDFVASSRAVVELVPDVMHVVRRLEIRGATSLADGEASGTTTDGNRYSWGYQLVTQWAAGRITRLEIFDTTDPASARSRFEALAREPRMPDVDNDAVGVQERLAWFGVHGDLDGARSLLAPDLLAIDRRPGVAAPDMVGPDARLANLAAVAEVFERIDWNAMAVRGDRLLLLGWTISADGFATTGYDVTEIDTDGRICRIVTFDETQRADAIEELERRHRVLSGDDPPAPTLASLTQPVSVAFAARDWEWIRSRVAPDVAVEDRRSTVSSHRVVGAEAVSALFRGFAEVGFETLDNIHVASRGDHLVLLRRVYRSAAGFELEMLAVVETGADGLMASLVLFDADALVPALDELELRYARSGSMARPERAVLVGFAALNHRRWREFDVILAPDVEVIDHRRLGFPASAGPEGLVSALQSLVAQVPDVVAIIGRIETSGDAVLAVVDQVGTSADGVAADWRWHNLIVIDRAGRICRMEYFDADEEQRARARYQALAGPGDA